MTLGDKQRKFTQLLAGLLRRAHEMGYEVTLGETYRPPETAALYAKQGRGAANSLHTQRLAIDLNLFRNGQYLTDSEDYRALGDWWKSQNELCCWGGDFNRPDGNHYSLTHNGVC